MKTKSLLLLAEWGVLFLLIPLLFFLDLLPVPKVLALVAVSLLVVTALRRDEEYSFREDWYGKADTGEWRRFGKRAVAVTAALLVLVFLVNPGMFLAFPKSDPVTWGVVMLLYPFLSALPQELIYRSWFFRRYRTLFGPGPGTVIASALSFSFLHIVYDNPWALVLSFIGGLLFARTYFRSRSLLLAAAEHALYGCLVFTIGMGGYFYEPF